MAQWLMNLTNPFSALEKTKKKKKKKKCGCSASFPVPALDFVIPRNCL